MVSIIPKAVSGLTNDDAPSLADVPGGRTRHDEAPTARYWEYIEPPAIATVRPSSDCESSEAPVATTVPAPSLPTVSDLPTRAARVRSAPPTSGAETTGRSGVPSTTAE